MLPFTVWFPPESMALQLVVVSSQFTMMSPSRMLFPLMTKLFTRPTELAVTTAPAKPPNTGVRAMKLSIFWVTLPLTVPVESTFTDCGRVVSEKGPVVTVVPLGSLYQVGVIVNVAVPGAAATRLSEGTRHESRLDACVCSTQL